MIVLYALGLAGCVIHCCQAVRRLARLQRVRCPSCGNPEGADLTVTMVMWIGGALIDVTVAAWIIRQLWQAFV